MAENTQNTGQENLRVSQTQEPNSYTTVNQNKGNLTVREQLHNLLVKQKYGHLTPDEREQLQNLQNQVNGDDKSKDVKRSEGLSKDKPKDLDDKDRKFFEEKDILEYLYGEMLNGANWLCNRALNTAWSVASHTGPFIYDTAKKAKQAFKEGRKESQEEAKASRAAMEGYTEKTDRTWTSYIEKDFATADTVANRYDEKINRFRAACDPRHPQANLLTEEEMNSNFYQRMMASPDPQAFCRQASERVHTAVTNLKTINAMAAMLARTQLVQNNMGKETPDQVTTEENFKSLSRRNAYLIAQYVDASPNPITTMRELQESIAKATKTANKSLDKGKFKSNDKTWFNTPLKNKALLRINDLLGLDSQGNLLQRQPVYTEQTMFQALVQAQDTEAGLNELLNDNTNDTQAALAAASENDNRRNHAQQRIQAISQKLGRPVGALSQDKFNQAEATANNNTPAYKVNIDFRGGR